MAVSKGKQPKQGQSQRFIDAGASEDEAVFDENLRRLTNAKPGPPKRKDDE